MPKGQNLIQHVKITNTSSGKVVTLDGAEAGSVIDQIDNLTVENRNKAYIRYQDPVTKSQVVLELCCVEIERLPNTVEEYDARECELDCCEQQFFGTFKTSVNQQTGEFPKKSQPSVPEKPKDETTPDKPKEDTQTKPSENGGSDSGNTTPTNPSDNNGSTDNGNTGTTEPTTPSDKGNSGKTDNGNTTPTQPTEEPTVTNSIVVKGMSDTSTSGSTVLLTIPVKGKVGETVRVGDFITPELLGQDQLLDDGRRINKKYDSGYVDYNINIEPNIKDFMYTIKEDGTEFVITARHEEEIH